jgi:hypothetical protein
LGVRKQEKGDIRADILFRTPIRQKILIWSSNSSGTGRTIFQKSVFLSFSSVRMDIMRGYWISPETRCSGLNKEKIIVKPMVRGNFLLLSNRTVRKGGIPANLFCDLQFHERGYKWIFRFIHAGGDHRGMFLAKQTRCIPGFLVMVPGSFINDTVFTITLGAGKPYNVSGSCSGNFVFYRMFCH